MKKIKELIREKIKKGTKSVRTKLFFIMTITIMAIIILLILVNSIIVESYYLYYKRETLLGSYNNINKYIKSNNISTSYIELELQKMAINNNLNILITDNNNISIYNSSKDFKFNLQEMNKGKVLYNKNNTYIVEAKDNKRDINF